LPASVGQGAFSERKPDSGAVQLRSRASRHRPAHWRRGPQDQFSLLPQMRRDGLLPDRGLGRQDCNTRWRVRRTGVSGADILGVWRAQARLGRAAWEHRAHGLADAPTLDLAYLIRRRCRPAADVCAQWEVAVTLLALFRGTSICRSGFRRLDPLARYPITVAEGKKFEAGPRLHSLLDTMSSCQASLSANDLMAPHDAADAEW